LKTLARSLLLDFVGPFLFALFALTFILLMDRLFLMIDLLVRKGIPLSVVAELVVLSMPFVMTISTPLAMLIAAVICYGRASQDNEIAAIRSAGIQVFRVFVPVVGLGIALFGLMVWFNGYVAAESNFRLRNLMMDMATKRPAIRIEPRVFMTDFEGYTIYIGTMNEKTSQVTDVLIWDRTQSGTPDLIVAPRGNVAATADEQYLKVVLDSGELHQSLPDRKYRRLAFREHTIYLPLNEELVRRDREYRGNREMTLTNLEQRRRTASQDLAAQRKTIGEILKKAKLTIGDSIRLNEQRNNLRVKQRELGRYHIEINKRYSLAFSCFLFLFFGAPLGILLRRGGLGVGFLVGLLFFAAFYILLLAGEELAGSGRLSPFFGMWLGNILLLPAILELCGRTFFDYSFLDLIWYHLPVVLQQNFLGATRGIGRVWRRLVARLTRAFRRPSPAGSKRPRRFGPPVFDRFLLREFVKFVFLALAVVVGIYILIDLFEDLSYFMSRKVPLFTLLRYYAYFTPSAVSLLYPVSFVLSCFLVYGRLTRQRELSALQSSGVDAYRLFRPVLLLGLFSALVFYVANEYISIPAAIALQDLKRYSIEKRTPPGGQQRKDMTYVADNGRIFFARELNVEGTMRDFVIADVNPERSRITRRIDGAAASWVDGRWHAQHAVTREFPTDTTELIASLDTLTMLNVTETPHDFSLETKVVEQMPVPELMRQVGWLQKAGLPTGMAVVELDYRFSYPFVGLVLLIMALPLATRLRKGGVMLGLGLGMLFSFLFWGAIQTCKAFGQSGTMSPLLSSWLPNIVFLLVGLAFIPTVKR